MSAHEVVDEQVEGTDGVVLVSRASDLRVAFAPGVGMVGYSMRHRGEELLGRRGGLTAYRARGSSFGIPLLYPWANRLSGRDYSAAGREVVLDPERCPVRLDANGLPIHGVLSASPFWQLDRRSASPEGAEIGARLDFGAHHELLAAFPFPHELRVEIELADDTLRVATVLLCTGDDPVPVSFGWHPYLCLPGLPREQWRVELPVRTRALLDERGIPTGREEQADIVAGELGDRTYDDLFTELSEPPRFALEGAGRRIELELGEGYSMGQVYAPPGEPFICFEPMTAPTNALVSGAGLRMVPPGGAFRAEFRLRVLGRA